MPDAPLTWQVVIHQSLFNRPLLNILNVKDLAAMSYARADQLAQVVADWIINDYRLNFSTGLSFVALEVISLDSAFPYTTIYTQDLPVSGSLDQGAEAVNVAMRVNFFTGGLGRAFKGRAYVSGLPVQDRSGNNWLSAKALSVQESWGNLLTILPLDDYAAVVVSRYLNLVERDPYVTTVILGATTSLNVVDMGRRLDNTVTV